jgi:SAM-dependent methyltransferase
LTRVHPVAAAGFASAADVYERARPSYPQDAIDWLVSQTELGPGRTVVDLGAGTGKLTRLLLPTEARVVAVEPIAEMRAHIAGAEVVDGTAEAIPLPDSSADVVTVAQAFHWFDHGPALREIARVLRPGGRIALVWNTRDESEPWVTRLSDAAIGRETVEDRDAVAPIDASRLFEAVERTSFGYVQELDLELLLDLVRSRSYCAVLTPEERAPVLERVEDVFREHARGDVIELPYVTECFRAVRR